MHEVLAICARADVPAGLLNSIADIFDDPQYRARGNIGTYPSRIGELAVPDVVPRLSATPGAIKWLGPALGEHNDDVLRDVLGLQRARDRRPAQARSHLMPLPASPDRTELHVRTLEMRGYERDDGLYEIEGHLVDRKAKPLDRSTAARSRPARDSRHVGASGRRRRPGRARRDRGERRHAACDVQEATDAMRLVVGERIAHGWTSMVKERLGGKIGCTHLMEMLLPLATAAFQTLAHVRLARPTSSTATAGR